jgi:D-arabinose 1-dehydrogenase-like Zn-dependent alcohol dehydrogenase
MHDVEGWAAAAPGATIERWTFPRRDPRDPDVVVALTHCGICATDLHTVRGGDPSIFPLVPGHEMVGVVTAVGSAVTRFAVGDPVAIGNIVDSCRVCPPCQAGRENACERFPTLTYGGPDLVSGGTTHGGQERRSAGPRRRRRGRLLRREAAGRPDPPLRPDRRHHRGRRSTWTPTWARSPSTGLRAGRHPARPLARRPDEPDVREKRIAGTGSGGLPGTQEMLDFCAEHAIAADIELVRPTR